MDTQTNTNVPQGSEQLTSNQEMAQVTQNLSQMEKPEKEPHQGFFKKKKYWLLTFLVILLLGAVGIFAFRYYKQKQLIDYQKQTQPVLTQTTTPSSFNNTKINISNSTFTHPKNLYTVVLPLGWTIVQKNTNSYQSTGEQTEDYIITSPDYIPKNIDNDSVLAKGGYVVPDNGGYVWLVVEKACSNDNQWNFDNNIPRISYITDELQSKIKPTQVDGMDAIQYEYIFPDIHSTAIDTVVTAGGYLYTFMYRYSLNKPELWDVYTKLLSSVVFLNKSDDQSIHPYSWETNMQLPEYNFSHDIPIEWSTYGIGSVASLKYPNGYVYWINQEQPGNIAFFNEQSELDKFYDEYRRCKKEHAGDQGGLIWSCDNYSDYYSFSITYNFDDRVGKNIDWIIQQGAQHYPLLCSEKYIPIDFFPKPARIHYYEVIPKEDPQPHPYAEYELFSEIGENKYLHLTIKSPIGYEYLNLVFASLVF